MRAHGPGRAELVEGDNGCFGMHRRNCIRGAHAGQAERLVGRPELPDALQLRCAQCRRAAEPQRLIGTIQHAQRVSARERLPRRAAPRNSSPSGMRRTTRSAKHVGYFVQSRLRQPERTGRLASPEQLRGIRFSGNHQPVRVGRLRIVAVAVRRQPDGAALPFGLRHLRSQGRDAKDEFAGAGGQHHALRIHSMKISQLLAQGAVAGVGVLAGIGLLDGRLCCGAWRAGVAVG